MGTKETFLPPSGQTFLLEILQEGNRPLLSSPDRTVVGEAGTGPEANSLSLVQLVEDLGLVRAESCRLGHMISEMAKLISPALAFWEVRGLRECLSELW